MGIDVNRLGTAAQRQALAKLIGQKKSKYNSQKAVRVMPNGKRRTFDSQREARRYDTLSALLKAGAIRDLRLQQTFTLQESYVTAEGEAVRAITYKADFTYERKSPEGWERVVEDAKGVRTDKYSIKRKMLLEKFGVSVREV